LEPREDPNRNERATPKEGIGGSGGSGEGPARVAGPFRGGLRSKPEGPPEGGEGVKTKPVGWNHSSDTGVGPGCFSDAGRSAMRVCQGARGLWITKCRRRSFLQGKARLSRTGPRNRDLEGATGAEPGPRNPAPPGARARAGDARSPGGLGELESRGTGGKRPGMSLSAATPSGSRPGTKWPRSVPRSETKAPFSSPLRVDHRCSVARDGAARGSVQ
jgi:hypothetical protein